MALLILKSESGESCFADSVTMTAFGMVMGAQEDPEEFMDWLGEDPRKFTTEELRAKYYEWLKYIERKEERLGEMNHLKEPDSER